MIYGTAANSIPLKAIKPVNGTQYQLTIFLNAPGSRLKITDEEIESIIEQLPMTKFGVPRKKLEELVRQTEYEPGLDVVRELRKLNPLYKRRISYKELQ